MQTFSLIADKERKMNRESTEHSLKKKGCFGEWGEGWQQQSSGPDLTQFLHVVPPLLLLMEAAQSFYITSYIILCTSYIL